MLWIRHRVNQIAALARVSVADGVEIDLRSDVTRPGAIHLSHDPWVKGDDFGEWLITFRHLGIRGPINLNTKEDGLEDQIVAMLSNAGLIAGNSWFFLDTAMPTLVKQTHSLGNSYFFLRQSVHEPSAALEPFRGKAQWIWVDCFNGEPVPSESIRELKKDFKICLVSPELQGIESMALSSHLLRFKDLFALADAVCTKDPERWLQVFS